MVNGMNRHKELNEVYTVMDNVQNVYNVHVGCGTTEGSDN